MKYNELTVQATKKDMRVGRGISAGRGKTAGRGTKGQNSRSGSGRKPGFEGGQNPLVKRLPKLRGFKSHQTKPEVVYTDQLSKFGVKVDNIVLADAGLLSNAHVNARLVLRGQVTKKVTVALQSATKGAQAELKKNGSSFVSVARLARTKKQYDKI